MNAIDTVFLRGNFSLGMEPFMDLTNGEIRGGGIDVPPLWVIDHIN
jgi:hypothetical protein